MVSRLFRPSGIGVAGKYRRDIRDTRAKVFSYAMGWKAKVLRQGSTVRLMHGVKREAEFLSSEERESLTSFRGKKRKPRVSIERMALLEDSRQEGGIEQFAGDKRSRNRAAVSKSHPQRTTFLTDQMLRHEQLE
ncbi:hypothetical protein BSKO_11705 [Bryopsis sp. KO-2023]|nr:hypothetical protein BSKO_11705 [Bryopsis sp. KO-2023]